MDINYKDLTNTDFNFVNVVAYRMDNDTNIEYNYETYGRTKHLLFCQMEGDRHYYCGNRHICTLTPGDVLFLPHGAKYRSFVSENSTSNTGIGISFDLISSTGEAIMIDEDIRLFLNRKDNQLLKRFKKILYSVANPAHSILRLKGELFSLLDELFADREKREDFDEAYKDIMAAITLLETKPENNLNLKSLGEMCHMSESSFLRKFKEYSGGITPIKYRNNIRFMLAEELASSRLTMNEIAEKLGFYDGAHLCKMYKDHKGYSLKRKE